MTLPADEQARLDECFGVAEPPAEPAGKPDGATLDDTVAVFRRWLHLPEPEALLAVLGAVAANRLPGDPVWLLLVGSPASGKSEILQSIGSLADVYPAATLTEAGLLSGTPKREKDKGATGGLLKTIGDYGIILAKDFGSVLSLHHDSRAQVLAALREVYDGSWTRVLGSDGGKTLHWEGKVGLIAGCTPTIDRHSAVMGAMGERFVLLRLPGADAHEQAAMSLKHASLGEQMRSELGSAVTALFDGQTAQPAERSEQDKQRLVNLAVLVVRCRSAVERDGYSREIELIPEPEAPARLVIVLDHLLAGLLSLGADPDTAWKVVQTAALDSIPALRRTVMERLVETGTEQTTANVAEAVGYPKQTTERTLEDLVAHGVVLAHRHGQGKATQWQISDWTAQNHAAATSSEKARSVSLSLCTHTTDIPDEVESNGHNDLPDGWTDDELQALVDSANAAERETV